MLEPLDRTVREMDDWLHEISFEMGRPGREPAYQALRGVLFAVRDALGQEELFDLAAQLPMLVRGLFFEGYHPAGKPVHYDRQGFLARVGSELHHPRARDPEAACCAVLAVLARRVDAAQMARVVDALPEEFREPAHARVAGRA